MHDCTDSTTTGNCWYGNGTTTEYTITYADKMDDVEFKYDNYAEQFKPLIRDWHSNRDKIKTKSAINHQRRNNNKRMNHNSGRFWHVLSN